MISAFDDLRAVLVDHLRCQVVVWSRRRSDCNLTITDDAHSEIIHIVSKDYADFHLTVTFWGSPPNVTVSKLDHPGPGSVYIGSLNLNDEGLLDKLEKIILDAVDKRVEQMIRDMANNTLFRLSS
jgi:hypothetical protein